MNKIYNIFIQLWSNIEIIILSISLILSPLILDTLTLPKGYELPKVLFLQITSVVLFLIVIIKFLIRTLNTKNLSLKTIRISKPFVISLILILLILISSLTSDYSHTALYGNSFRLQGGITHILMIIYGLSIVTFIKEKHIKYVLISLLISSVIQSILGFEQFFKLLVSDPRSILDGYWVNGSFGQANFFSGRLILGFLSGIYLLTLHIELKRIFKYLIKLLLLLSIILILVALVLSFSTWGILSIAVFSILILTYEIFNQRVFKVLLVLSFLISLGIFIYYLNSNPVFNLRLDIWNNIIDLLRGETNVVKIVFGYGFDTLGLVLSDTGRFVNIYVDRAHNFFLDLITQGGILFLISISSLILLPVIKFFKDKNTHLYIYLFVFLIMWLFRSFIHESGIVNLYDFILILTLCIYLSSDSIKETLNGYYIKLKRNH